MLKPCETLFGDNANIYEGSFLDYNTPESMDLNNQKKITAPF